MKAIINFFRQIFALSAYKLAIESIRDEQGQVVLRVRVRFSGFTYESTLLNLRDEIVKFPPLHAFVIGYLFVLSKNSKKVDPTKLELMKNLLNQDEFLTKFQTLLNCKMLHQSQKVELHAGLLKNEISIQELKAYPELISSISAQNAYQLGLAYGDVCG